MALIQMTEGLISRVSTWNGDSMSVRGGWSESEHIVDKTFHSQAIHYFGGRFTFHCKATKHILSICACNNNNESK